MNIEQGISIMLLAAAILILLVTILRLSKRRRPSWPPDGLETSAKRAQQDARQLIAQLEKLADDIDGKINKGIAELQELLSQAYTKTEQLRGSKTPDQGDTETSDLPPLGEEPSSAETTADEIRRLHESGLSSVEIARRLNRPIGEVELLLRLQRTNDSSQLSVASNNERQNDKNSHRGHRDHGV